jgi:hypothetical protein
LYDALSATFRNLNAKNRRRSLVGGAQFRTVIEITPP